MRAATCIVPTALALALAACQPAPTAADKAAAPAATATTAATPVAAAGMTDAQLIEHGDYLVRIAGCNDCHTPGYPESAGNVPKETWLTGTQVGWHGPWGTTYAANLRIRLADFDEQQWLDHSANLHTRPPMPDFAVRAMKEQDRLAIYRFVKSLGPGGAAAPAYLPPGQEPPKPFIEWNPPPPAPNATTAKPAAAG